MRKKSHKTKKLIPFTFQFEIHKSCEHIPKTKVISSAHLQEQKWKDIKINKFKKRDEEKMGDERGSFYRCCRRSWEKEESE